MNEKQIAQTVLTAQKMREASYSEELRDYTLSIESCLIGAGKTHELSDNMWALLTLAIHWWNDIQIWANDVMAGKNILEELDTESKIDAQERGVSVGPHPDDTIELTDKGRKFADEFRESRLLPPECEETDLPINLCDTCKLIAADCNNERETIGNTNHVIKCASYHKQDRLINLCDTCVSCPVDCGGVGMEYGDGPGNDNVIVCFAYTIKD